ncbi:hypothetical protein [Streptomyces noursei]|uniref:hypothetical protein n=1 Tax=Streptomyces noursei TaxID=1971 RepID=UPI0021A6BA7E|nr:hypothetical protein [Streptomyces noursei]UWS69823.1 hypothetical protein N1H47_00095 [Streptomyces noursei]UWS76956.1 hypothetical protein N1H47_40425 [Streptomyces noursei]
MNNVNDTASINRLLAFGFQPGLTPRRNTEYAALVDRCRTDQEFAQLLHAAARGFDLTVIAVDSRAGLVLGATAETSSRSASPITSANPPTDRSRHWPTWPSPRSPTIAPKTWTTQPTSAASRSATSTRWSSRPPRNWNAKPPKPAPTTEFPPTIRT